MKTSGRWIRKLLIGVPVFIAFAALVAVIGFFLVPHDRLNAIIAAQLTDAFGHQVTVAGRPSVHFLPYLSVTFGPVSVSRVDARDKALMEIERAGGRLSVTSILDGDPALRNLTLERAQIFIERDGDGRTNWATFRLFETDRNRDDPSLTLRFPDRLRTIQLVDSVMTITGKDTDITETVSAIKARIVGPPRFDALQVETDFTWRGEPVRAGFSIDEPGLFVIGQESAGSLSINTSNSVFNFDGVLAWRNRPVASGAIMATLNAPHETAEWLGFNAKTMLPSAALIVESEGTITTDRISLRPVTLGLQGGSADGRLEIGVNPDGIDLTGTLAFDQLVLDGATTTEEERRSLLETMANQATSGSSMDLRLSADTARVAELDMTNLAVSLSLKNSVFRINVGSIDLPAGEFDGEIAVERLLENESSSEADVPASVRLSANVSGRSINRDHLRTAYGLDLPLVAPLNVDIKAQSEGRVQSEWEESLRFSVEASYGEGHLRGVSLPSVFSADLSDASSFNGIERRTAFDNAMLTLNANGEGDVAISALEILTPSHVFETSGQADLIENTVSLVGFARDILEEGSDAGETSEVREVSFTLGGTVDLPRITSVDGVKLPSAAKLQ